MKAIPGHVYAVVGKGAVTEIFAAEDHPEWCDVKDSPGHPFCIEAIDVTDNVPALGDLWDGQTFTSPPDPPSPPSPPVNADKVDAKAKALTLSESGDIEDLKAFAAAIAKII